jgi:hypothetical protein
VPRTLLRIGAIVELVTLAALLTNLAGAHVPAVASLLGPIHGCAYLFVVGAAWRLTRSAPMTLLAAVPVAGGVITLARLRRANGAEK